MKISLALTGLALLTPSLLAQTTIRSALSASGNYGLFAAQGGTVDHNLIAAGRPIPTSATVSARIRGVGGIDTILGWRQRGNVVSVDISEQGALAVPRGGTAIRAGSTASATGGRIVPGPHALMLRIAGRPGTKGLIEAWSSGVTGDGVAVKYGVDVGNDGRTDFAAAPPRAASRILAVRIPTSGVLMVKLSSEVTVGRSAGTSARFKTGLSVRFTPGEHCALRTYGESCGTRLAGRYVAATSGGGGLQLSATGGRPRGQGLMMLGLRELSIRFPGSRCPLLNEVRWVVPFRWDTNGAQQWAFRIPAGTVGDVKLQVTDLSGGIIRASNGLQVVCID